MRRLTNLVGFTSTTDLISLAGVRKLWNSRSATNIRFKAISFRKVYVGVRSCPFRWRVLSGTWRQSKPFFGQLNLTAGKRRKDKVSAFRRTRGCRRSAPRCSFTRSMQSGTLRLHDIAFFGAASSQKSVCREKSRESPACIAHKSLKICERCRLRSRQPRHGIGQQRIKTVRINLINPQRVSGTLRHLVPIYNGFTKG
jgi:hypothetical protein